MIPDLLHLSSRQDGFQEINGLTYHGFYTTSALSRTRPAEVNDKVLYLCDVPFFSAEDHRGSGWPVRQKRRVLHITLSLFSAM
jgi:hypothetical protein